MGVYKIFRGSNLGVMLMGSVLKFVSFILIGEYFYILKIFKEMICYFFLFLVKLSWKLMLFLIVMVWLIKVVLI